MRAFYSFLLFKALISTLLIKVRLIRGLMIKVRLVKVPMGRALLILVRTSAVGTRPVVVDSVLHSPTLSLAQCRSLPIICLIVSQIRHEPVAPTRVQTHAAGDVIDRHQHDDHQLIYSSTGVLAIQTARGSWVAAPDRAVWVPAGTWHQHRFYGQSSFHTVGFPTTADPPLPIDRPTVVVIGALARELVIACTEPGLPESQAQRIRAVLQDRLPLAPVQPLALPTARDPRLARACRLVTDDLSHPRSTAWLARRVGASERTLARLFRTEFGTTYPQWRSQVRVFRALIELADGADVTGTAQRCGWSTTSAFIDTFGKIIGQTPGSYRSVAAMTTVTGRAS